MPSGPDGIRAARALGLGRGERHGHDGHRHGCPGSVTAAAAEGDARGVDAGARQAHGGQGIGQRHAAAPDREARARDARRWAAAPRHPETPSCRSRRRPSCPTSGAARLLRHLRRVRVSCRAPSWPTGRSCPVRGRLAGEERPCLVGRGAADGARRQLTERVVAALLEHVVQPLPRGRGHRGQTVGAQRVDRGQGLGVEVGERGEGVASPLEAIGVEEHGAAQARRRGRGVEGDAEVGVEVGRSLRRRCRSAPREPGRAAAPRPTRARGPGRGASDRAATVSRRRSRATRSSSCLTG